MSEIDPRPMEVHLLKICDEIIRLDCDDSATNTKHLNNICRFLFEQMGKNNKVFNELFQSIVPAGSYADNLKISEPDEYDLLIVLKFPNPVVTQSRPGYVTINVSEAIRNGWNTDNYQLFVDDDGYLIQNKVLNWIRSVVREALLQHNNLIEVEPYSYEVNQSSNGPAVTLDVTVLRSENIQFAIDFVGCLAFHSDEWWTADVSCYAGIWNAVPKPIKQNENTVQQLAKGVNAVVQKTLPREIKNPEKGSLTTENDNNKSGKAKRPPSCFRYKNQKSKVSGNVEAVTVDTQNTKNRPRNWYRRPKRTKLEVDTKEERIIPVENVNVPNMQNSKWEKSTANVKGNTSQNGFRRRAHGPWSRQTMKTNMGDVKVDETSNIRKVDSEKKPSVSVAKEMEKTRGNFRYRNNNPKNRKVNATKESRATKPKEQDAAIFIPNPQENREWICSYAEIERQLLKGTQTMKPLIRIFKKIRDKKQLTNLKSFFIKTIFLHQHLQNGSDYWKQSLAVLFMEMFDVILTHLEQHRIDSFWHRDFNLLRDFRSGQIDAVYEQWIKLKKDLISNLENGNPEFIYEVICTEEERSLLEQSDSESEDD